MGATISAMLSTAWGAGSEAAGRYHCCQPFAAHCSLFTAAASLAVDHAVINGISLVFR